MVLIMHMPCSCDRWVLVAHIPAWSAWRRSAPAGLVSRPSVAMVGFAAPLSCSRCYRRTSSHPHPSPVPCRAVRDPAAAARTTSLPISRQALARGVDLRYFEL